MDGWTRWMMECIRCTFHSNWSGPSCQITIVWQWGGCSLWKDAWSITPTYMNSTVWVCMIFSPGLCWASSRTGVDAFPGWTWHVPRHNVHNPKSPIRFTLCLIMLRDMMVSCWIRESIWSRLSPSGPIVIFLLGVWLWFLQGRVAIMRKRCGSDVPLGVCKPLSTGINCHFYGGQEPTWHLNPLCIA